MRREKNDDEERPALVSLRLDIYRRLRASASVQHMKTSLPLSTGRQKQLTNTALRRKLSYKVGALALAMCLRFLRCDHASSTPRARECAHTADPANGGSLGRRGGRRRFSSNSCRRPSTYLDIRRRRPHGLGRCFQIHEIRRSGVHVSSGGLSSLRNAMGRYAAVVVTVGILG